MLVSSLVQLNNVLNVGYQSVKFLYNLGFLAGCISGGIYYMHTIIKRNGDDILHFNFATSFVFFRLQNFQLYIIRKYIPITLPFLVPIGVFASPIILFRNIKKSIIKVITIAREYKDRKVEISSFIEQKPEYCPVCLENLTESDNPLSCGHYIHRGCIIRSRKTCCPLCKRELQLSIEEYMRTKYPELV
jgi:hypothetical protein